MTLILDSFACIKITCLHLGQKKGKFFNSVSGRILIRVLLPHIGQHTHSIHCSTSVPPLQRVTFSLAFADGMTDFVNLFEGQTDFAKNAPIHINFSLWKLMHILAFEIMGKIIHSPFSPFSTSLIGVSIICSWALRNFITTSDCFARSLECVTIITHLPI